MDEADDFTGRARRPSAREQNEVIGRLSRLQADPMRFDYGDQQVSDYTDRQFERVYEGGGEAPVRTDFERFTPSVDSSDLVLAGSVGAGGDNRPPDVFKTAKLLHNAGGFEFAPGIEPVGEATPRFQRALAEFQIDNDLKIDGLVHPGGPTLHALGRDALGPADGRPPSLAAAEFEDRFAKPADRTESGKPIFDVRVDRQPPSISTPNEDLSVAADDGDFSPKVEPVAARSVTGQLNPSQSGAPSTGKSLLAPIITFLIEALRRRSAGNPKIEADKTRLQQIVQQRSKVGTDATVQQLEGFIQGMWDHILSSNEKYERELVGLYPSRIRLSEEQRRQLATLVNKLGNDRNRDFAAVGEFLLGIMHASKIKGLTKERERELNEEKAALERDAGARANKGRKQREQEGDTPPKTGKNDPHVSQERRSKWRIAEEDAERREKQSQGPEKEYWRRYKEHTREKAIAEEHSIRGKGQRR